MFCQIFLLLFSCWCSWKENWPMEKSKSFIKYWPNRTLRWAFIHLTFSKSWESSVLAMERRCVSAYEASLSVEEPIGDSLSCHKRATCLISKTSEEDEGSDCGETSMDAAVVILSKVDKNRRQKWHWRCFSAEKMLLVNSNSLWRESF